MACKTARKIFIAGLDGLIVLFYVSFFNEDGSNGSLHLRLFKLFGIVILLISSSFITWP